MPSSYSDQYESSKFKPNQYTTINQNPYACLGSECSCRFLNTRTNFDTIQQQQFQTGNYNVDLPVVKSFPDWNRR